MNTTEISKNENSGDLTYRPYGNTFGDISEVCTTIKKEGFDYYTISIDSHDSAITTPDFSRKIKITFSETEIKLLAKLIRARKKELKAINEGR